MADTDALKETLDALSELAPRMGDGLAGLAREAAATQAAVDELLQRLADREREAASLLVQIETALGSVRVAAAPAELHTHDLASILSDPGLSFEDRVFRFCVLAAQRQEEKLQAMAQAWQGRIEEQRSGLGAARLEHPAALLGLQGAMETAHEAAVVEVAGLQGAVTAAREAVDGQVDRLSADLERQRGQAARDLDELRKDLAGMEESFAERLLRAGAMVTEDAERISEETRARLDDLHEVVSRSLDELGQSIREMNDALRRATEQAADGRREVVPLFDDLDSRLGPLRRAIDSVRDAARSVGIPF
jgi:hypothetical protein